MQDLSPMAYLGINILGYMTQEQPLLLWNGMLHTPKKPRWKSLACGYILSVVPSDYASK